MRVITGIKHTLSVISYHAIWFSQHQTLSFTVFKHNKTKAKKLNSYSETCTFFPFPFDSFQYSESSISERALLLIATHGAPCHGPAHLASANTWPRGAGKKNIWANRPEQSTWGSHEQPIIHLWRCYQTIQLQELSQLGEGGGRGSILFTSTLTSASTSIHSQ